MELEKILSLVRSGKILISSALGLGKIPSSPLIYGTARDYQHLAYPNSCRPWRKTGKTWYMIFIWFRFCGKWPLPKYLSFLKDEWHLVFLVIRQFLRWLLSETTSKSWVVRKWEICIVIWTRLGFTASNFSVHSVLSNTFLNLFTGIE